MCGTCSADNTPASTRVTEDVRAYKVEGMTCGSCANSVSTEVGGISGVTSVKVDLAQGQVLIEGTDFDDESVRDAVEKAGYQFVGS